VKKIKEVLGNTKGLQKHQLRQLSKLYEKRVKGEVVSQDIAKIIASISADTGRQVGLLVDRKGNITHVIVGDSRGIVIPDLSYFRYYPGRLKGLRCIHTHFGGKCIDDEDITDLLMLRLDAMVVVEVTEEGLPGRVEMAYLLPPNPKGERYNIIKWPHPSRIDLDFESFIKDLEDQIYYNVFTSDGRNYEERAILVYVFTPKDWLYADYYMMELERLCESAGVKVLDKVVQKVKSYNPHFLIGKGKIQDIIIKALYLGATMLIFNEDLSPTQLNNIVELTDLKVIDRTQLILDIFARRAISREGKLQVELAQLKYTYPRIIGRGTAMSRLAGGIGGRGPGETKLEIDRRVIKKRISILEDRLRELMKERLERRKARRKSGIPVISLVGYTNAGKTSLLVALTGSNGYVANKLFATLDPLARTFYVDGVGKCILTDTVGFIRRMPEDIKVAFRATLEELYESDILLHVIDLSSPFMEEEIEVVEGMLKEMGLMDRPVIRVYNKVDLVDEEFAKHFESNGNIVISAKKRIGLDNLLVAIARELTPILGTP
jgi:GTP-binding protein HflX